MPPVQECLLPVVQIETSWVGGFCTPSPAAPLPTGAGSTQQPGTPYLTQVTSEWDTIRRLPTPCDCTPLTTVTAPALSTTYLAKSELPRLCPHRHQGRMAGAAL